VDCSFGKNIRFSVQSCMPIGFGQPDHCVWTMSLLVRRMLVCLFGLCSGLLLRTVLGCLCDVEMWLLLCALCSLGFPAASA
jgi:hypothetical protein